MIARAALVLVLCAWCTVAQAEPLRVVVAEPDDALAAALRLALSSWTIEVRGLSRVRDAEPSPSDLALREQAAAVAWITHKGEHVTLHVYVTRTGVTTERALRDALPLEDDAAAAAALSVKAILRNAEVVPEPAPKAPELPPAQSSPEAPAPAPEAVVPAPRPPLARGDVEPGRSSRALARLRVDLGGGTRSLTALTSAPARFVATLAWFETRRTRRRLGATAEGTFTLPDALERAGLSGDFRAFALLAGLTAQWPLTSRLLLDPALRAGFERTRVVGHRAGSERFDARRTNLLVSVALGLFVTLGERWFAGPRLALELVPGADRYLVGDARVYRASPVSLEACLRLGVAL